MRAATVADLRDELLGLPEVRQMVDDVTELLKLEIVQSVRGVQRPTAVVRGGRSAVTAEALGSPVGALIVKQLDRLPATRRDTVREAFTLTAALRRSAQRLNVATDGRTTAARRPILAQVDVAQRFAGVDRSLRNLASKGGILAQLFTRPLSGTGGGAVANRGIRFLVDEVVCVKETSELGKDEIALGGIAVDADETTTILPESDLGKFKTGDRRTFNPAREMTAFNFDGDYPKNFAVFVALAEKDLGGFSNFLAELYEGIKNEVSVVLTAIGAAAGAWIGSQVGAGMGAAIGGPLGVVIGVIAGAILGALVGWFVSITKDDIFAPQVAGLTLLSADADFGATGLTSGPLTLTFSDHGGAYQVRYNWLLRR